MNTNKNRNFEKDLANTNNILNNKTKQYVEKKLEIVKSFDSIGIQYNDIIIQLEIEL